MSKDENVAAIELPKYICHKTVHALKIKKIKYVGAGKSEIIPEDGRFAAFNPGYNYIRKHDPQAGGYYVVYEDGYKSFSPASAFESGYDLIETPLAAAK